MKAKTAAPPVKVVPVRRAAGGDARASSMLQARVQPKLHVGAANDPLEHEADRMAERVVSMPSPALAAPPAAPPASPLPSARRDDSGGGQPNLDTLPDPPAVPAEHADANVADKEDVNTQALAPADMAEIETGKPEGAAEGGEGGAEGGGAAPADAGAAAAPAAGGNASPPPAEDTAKRAADDGTGAVVGAEGGAAPDDVAGRVAAPGSGRKLPDSIRAYMEPRFGADFSNVRIHDAAEDRMTARRIGARAFTYRDHIWIGPGESVEDKRLLAHELTHVVQQTAPAAPDEAGSGVNRSIEPVVQRGYIRDKAEKYAREVPGYSLICVIVGRSLITGNDVPRTAENLVGGFLGLLPVIGNQIFDQLKETGALQAAFDWISERMTALNITWARVRDTIEGIPDAVVSWHPIRNLINLFSPLVEDIMTFIGEIVEKVLEFIIRAALKLAGPYADQIWEVIQKARKTISLILKDPLGFAKNLVSAVVGGFKLFGANIWEHLKRGLLGWLFGNLSEAGLQLPEKLDLKGLLSIGLQVVGLTYDRFRAKLVKAMDPNGARKMGFIEKSVEIVSILVKEGFTGLWQKVLTMIDGFKQTVIGGIQEYVTSAIINAGLAWLAGLTNPIGAIIKVVMSIYQMIVVFIERLEQIKAVAMSIFDSIGEIASGQTERAAQYVEKTIAGTIPIVISFLAALMGLGGISEKIRAIIKKIQAPVDAALTKMVNFVVGHSKKLFSKLISKLNKKRTLPSVTFKVGKTTHRLFTKKAARKLGVFIASDQGHEAQEVSTATAAVGTKLTDEQSSAEAKKLGKGVADMSKHVKTEATKAGDVDSEKDNKNASMAAVEKAEQDEAKKTTEAAAKTDEKIQVESAHEGPALIRTKEPRFEELEGKQGTHAALKGETKKTIKGSSAPYSTYLEVDHVVEKALPKAILENLETVSESKAGLIGPLKIFRTADRTAKAAKPKVAEKQEGGKDFGQIGSKGSGFEKIDEDGGKLPSMVIYHRIHTGKKKPLVDGPALVHDAARAPDPHAFLRAHLAKELKHEADSVAGLYRNDKSSTDKIKAGIDEGVKNLVQQNTVLYGLAAVAAAAKATDPAEEPVEAQNTALITPAKPGPGKPDFATIEGKGAPYGQQQGGVGDLIEYDHVIDKSLPLAAKSLAIGDDTVPVPADGMSKRQIADAQGRKTLLAQAPLFAEGSAMSKYSEYNGFSIGLYRPVHLAVTRAVKVNSAEPIRKARAAGAKALETFVREGKLSDLQATRAPIHAALRAEFEAHLGSHTRAIQAEYAQQENEMVSFNPGHEDAARAAIKAIVGHVNNSLRDAGAAMQALFP